MPPLAGSRYMFCQAIRDFQGRLYLTDREPYRFFPHPDNRYHIVAEENTLFTLAGVYFAPLPRACGFWWVIADFQPEPILDPTQPLQIGRQLVIPAVRVLTDVIFGEGQRRAHE